MRSHQFTAASVSKPLYNTYILPYQAPYNWSLMFDFLAYHAIPEIEWVDTDNLRYARTLQIGSTTGWVMVQVEPQQQQCQVHLSHALLAHSQTVLTHCKQVFDLQINPVVIDTALSQHDQFKPLVEQRPGLRVPGSWNYLECCVRTIAGQLVSVKSATTISRRMVTQYGSSLVGNIPAELKPVDDSCTHLFPTATQLAKQAMPDVGLTKARSRVIQQLAELVANKHLNLHEMHTLDEVVTALTALPGIGSWTAEYVAMRAHKIADAFPAGDLILRRTIIPNTDLTEAQCRKASLPLSPWRAYAALHLWTDYLAIQSKGSNQHA